MAESPIRLFIFGLGYTATAFARSFKDRAEWIAGTVRSRDKVSALAPEGIRAFIFDGQGSSDDVSQALAEVTHILISIPPGEADDPVLTHHADDIVAAKQLRWLGYLSTIGVYGDYGGAWIDERTIPHPVHERTKARLKAETAWMKLARQREIPIGIFRIGGIYGPGRNAFVNLSEGKAHRVATPGQMFNRIHVADIATTLAAAIATPATRIYNVSDDEPATRSEVMLYAAGLMGVPPPPETTLAEADLSPMARSFYAENRRVANRRIKEELRVTLRYPTYREGLSALWRDGNWRG